MNTKDLHGALAAYERAVADNFRERSEVDELYALAESLRAALAAQPAATALPDEPVADSPFQQAALSIRDFTIGGAAPTPAHPIHEPEPHIISRLDAEAWGWTADHSATALPAEPVTPGTAAARFTYLMDELEKRFPHPAPHDSTKTPERYALEALDRALAAHPPVAPSAPQNTA